MLWREQKKDWRTPGAIALAVGAGAGVVAAVFLGIRSRRARWTRRPDIEQELLELETAVVEALANDEFIGSMPVEVEAIAQGIVELTGQVETEFAAHRAVELAQTVPDVRTVLNRMEIMVLETQLARSRARAESGDPGYSETRWSGMGVGMGGRRQSRTTDPDRPSDRVDMVTREYEADRMARGDARKQVPGAGTTGETPPL
jgi:hypothetical protein